MRRTLRAMTAAAELAHRRRHRSLEQRDRRALERNGWRTLLDYRENHVRDADGRLVHVVPQWTAEAERLLPGACGDRAVLATVTACSRAEAWALLRRAADRVVRDGVSRNGVVRSDGGR